MLYMRRLEFIVSVMSDGKSNSEASPLGTFSTLLSIFPWRFAYSPVIRLLFLMEQDVHMVDKTPWPLVRERTIPTDRPPLVDEI
jgi:hypothetical protein